MLSFPSVIDPFFDTKKKRTENASVRESALLFVRDCFI
ncbi:hypothetical protein EH11_01166 [Bacillus subtilis]|nr:hypothetical protein EH11_01166 [Bacillus subtilis]RUS02110.1 hypothetical protein EFW59_01165 [Bacillus subtilis]BAI85520.1 hypothetical protein BSNT_08418 [Bacillus subtilis subsp. natto BEST195]GAK81508.1 hypothetical protein BSMD_034240 [Bacillus subtilis Miyagi-4]